MHMMPIGNGSQQKGWLVILEHGRHAARPGGGEMEKQQ